MCVCVRVRVCVCACARVMCACVRAHACAWSVCYSVDVVGFAMPRAVVCFEFDRQDASYVSIIIVIT